MPFSRGLLQGIEPTFPASHAVSATPVSQPAVVHKDCSMDEFRHSDSFRSMMKQ